MNIFCFYASCAFLGFGSLLRAGDQQQRETETLHTIATASLLHNIQHLTSGDYLSAGAHQFKSLWTRDFAYRVRALLLIGRGDIVRRQIELTLRYRRRSDGALPKGLDNFPHNERSIYFSLKRLLPIHATLKLAEPLTAIYEDQNNSLAIDSNLLIIHAALDYLAFTKDYPWWESIQPQLLAAFRYYDRFIFNGLVKQAEYADWQDTVKRQGTVLLTNLLFYHCLERLHAFPAFAVSTEQVRSLRQKIIATFRPSPDKPFFTFSESGYVNSDENLLALDFDFYPPASREAAKLYQAFKKHPLWRQKGHMPGRVAFPSYPRNWQPIYVRMVGLKKYHDEFYWSWLMALGAKIAYKMGDIDEGKRIFSELSRIAKRDHWIYEVYQNKHHLPIFEGVLVKSEGPFTWGANFTLDLIDFTCSNHLRKC